MAHIRSTMAPFVHIVLGVTGAIDCLQTFGLAIEVRKICSRLTVVMTPTAARLFPPQSLRVLPETEILSDSDGTNWKNHMDLAGSADIILIAPASANTITKIALGIADNLLTTIALATNRKMVIAPAMAGCMWENPIVKRNCALLIDGGVSIIQPVLGTEVATLTPQVGAMLKPAGIVDYLLKFKRRQNQREFEEYLSNSSDVPKENNYVE